MTEQQISSLLELRMPGWVLDGPLGAGTYGRVYRVRKDTGTRATYAALKVITIPNDTFGFGTNRTIAGKNWSKYYDEIAQHLMDEYRIMDQFRGNSNIVSCEEFSQDKNPENDGWIILIRMELLTPFAQYLEEKGLSRQELIHLGIDICTALELCRRVDVIHRDIKPENIFVSNFGDFKLGDFGVAKNIEKGLAGMSKQGTYDYMAPEIYHGSKNYDFTIDLYSLGLMLYWFMNNNKPPFVTGELTMETEEESMDKRMSGEPFPFPANDRTTLAEIICKACSFNAADRYQHPRDMKKALLSLLDENDTVMFCEPAQRGSVDVKNTVYLGSAARETVYMGGFSPKQSPDNAQNEAVKEVSSSDNVTDSFESAFDGSFDFSGEKAESTEGSEKKLKEIMAKAQLSGIAKPSKSIIKEPKKAVPEKEKKKEAPVKEKKVAPVKEKKAAPAKEKKPTFAKKGAAGSTATTGEVAVAAGSSKTKAKSGKKVLVAAFIIIGAVAVIILIATMVGRSQRRRVPTTRLPEAEATPAVEELVAEEASEAPVVVEWSDWEESIPADITAEEYIIEKKLQYRSSALQVFDSADAAPEGYEFLRMSYGEWSEWSAPQSKAVEESDTVNVEKTSATTYQYRVYSTKTVQVEGLNATTVVSSWSNWTNCSYNDYVRYSKMGDSYQVGKNTKNTYKYRTRVAEYYYVDPSSATAYSDLVICPADDKLVSTRTLYRWTPRLEAGTPSMDNVPKIVTDYTGRFTDVDDSQWYGAQSSNFLAVVSELGIMSADEYRFFYPEDSATLGDIVKASVVLYRLINGEEGILVESETSPNMVYFDYAADHSLINPGYFTDLDIPATRAQAAYILSSVLDMVDHMSGIDAAANTIDFIDDVEETHIFYDEINRFIEAGIVSWAEPAGSFRPDDPLTRAQLAVMISHIAYPATRSSNMNE